MQADHQREVLPHPRFHLRSRHRAPQRDFGTLQLFCQRVGQAQIGQHGGIVGDDLERGRISLLRLGVLAHLIEHRAFSVEDAPIGIVRRLGAAERDQRLFVLPGLGERAAVVAKQLHVARVAQRGLFEHRDRLGALIGCTQRLRVGHGGAAAPGLAR